MERFRCNVIYGAPTTSKVKGLRCDDPTLLLNYIPKTEHMEGQQGIYGLAISKASENQWTTGPVSLT